jgi:sodium/bile acid cotransporter 7
MKLFLGCLALVLVVAWIYPYFGATTQFGWFVKNIGVSIIFLRSGLELETSKLIGQIANLKVSGSVLLFHFAICPILFKLTSILYSSTGVMSKDLATGFCLLGVLPPPISSAVIITTVSNGNAALSIVVSTLGSLAGVIITPALLVSVSGVRSEVSANALVIKLGTTVLFPLIVGQLARKVGAPKISGSVGKGILLAIIFHVFSKTFLKPLPITPRDLFFVVVCTLCQQLLLLSLIAVTTIKLQFDRKDVIALIFAGSHKSLTLGMPILLAMYGESVPAYIVLPLLVYHPMQIVVGSILAPKCAEFIQSGLKEETNNEIGIEMSTKKIHHVDSPNLPNLSISNV